MKVLLGIGGTDGSLGALERTVDRAVAAGDDLTVAIVESEGTDADRDELEARVESAVSGTELSVDVRHVEGEPGIQLVDIAESEGFDEIVLGGSTTSPMGKIKINQTAEFVLLNSHVTVTLVR
jgi:nucleotide-binding universal stress UspA family protein